VVKILGGVVVPFFLCVRFCCLDLVGYPLQLLFTLLAYRYERGSMLITSNLPFSKWEMIFKDPMTTAAAIDRLVHHSVVLELNVPSYRAEQAMKRKNKDK